MTKNLKIATITTVFVLIIAGVFTWSNQKNNLQCTMEARSGLTIWLQDTGGNSVTDAKITSEQETFFDSKDGSYSGLYEGVGKHTFKIEKDGFQTYTGNVDLEHDQCHVISQAQNIILETQETSKTPAIKPTVEEETKKQEIDAYTIWKTYTPKEGKISFEYPQQFFLLDKTKEDKRIYISSREIIFNDFAGGYYEPIEISFKDESKSNDMITSLENKHISETIINGKNALVISGVLPKNSPYYAIDVFAIFFSEQDISIIAANRFSQDNSTDLEIVARKIAATLTFD